MTRYLREAIVSGLMVLMAVSTGFAGHGDGPGKGARPLQFMDRVDVAVDSVEYRDPYSWPFDTYSFWNMPIGTGATYTPQPVSPGHIDGIMVDLDILIMTPDETIRPVYGTIYKWIDGTNHTTRCQKATEKVWIRLPVPDGYITTFYGTRPNNPGAILKADGRNIVQTQPFQVCSDSVITTGLISTGTSISRTEDTDLYGEGRLGNHGGSGLSSLGGAIRVGELAPGAGPIRHALKISFPGNHYLYYDHVTNTGFRWPARKHDSNAAESYNSTEPEAKIGCLRAIPPWIDIDSLGLETEPGRKIAWTLQNYGAYQVEGVPWARMMIAAEDGPNGCVPVEFKQKYGYDFVTQDQSGNPWYRDMVRIMPHLHIVDNNGPGSVGGGGESLQPLAPELSPARSLQVTTDGTPGAGVVPQERWMVTPGGTALVRVDVIPPGYRFSHWSVTGGDAVITDSTSSVAEVTFADSVASVKASFVREYYSLQTGVLGNGEIEQDPVLEQYTYGTGVILTAVPEEGWEFSGWSGDYTGDENPLELTVTGNTELVARFSPAYHTLTVGIGGGGTVGMAPEGDSLVWGTEVTLTATPGTGWEFRNWTGDLTSGENPLLLTMDRDWILYARFDSVATSLQENRQPAEMMDVHLILAGNPRRILAFFGQERGESSVALYDLLGKQVRSVERSSETAVYIPVEALSPGIYIAMVRNGQEIIQTHKFMIL